MSVKKPLRHAMIVDRAVFERLCVRPDAVTDQGPDGKYVTMGGRVYRLLPPAVLSEHD